jgi:hypothetical protein
MQNESNPIIERRAAQSATCIKWSVILSLAVWLVVMAALWLFGA